MARPRIPKTNKGWYGPFYHGTSVPSAERILKSKSLSIVNKKDREFIEIDKTYMSPGEVYACHYASFYTKDADRFGNIMRQKHWGEYKDSSKDIDVDKSAVIEFYTKVKPIQAKLQREDSDTQTVVWEELDVPIEIYKIYYFETRKIQSIRNFKNLK